MPNMDPNQLSLEPASKMGFPKGSFGLKMSKKVAELTQVVHMLFTRNHEREVELDELRDAYEQEISIVIQDAKSRIEKLEYKVRELERKRKKETDEVSANVNRVLRETQERLESMKNDLMEERRESTHLRDLLTQAHKDLEILKHGSSGVSGDLQKKNKILEDRERELQKLFKNYAELESRSIAASKHSEGLRHQLEQTREAMRRSKLLAEKSTKIAEEKSRVCQELIRKNKALEEEIKSLKRELNLKKRSSSTDGDTKPVGKDEESRKDHKFWDEIEKMKRENEWLRNELRNREGNFNRVFAEFRPVFLGGNAKSRGDRDMMMIMPSSSYSQHVESGRASVVPPITSLEGAYGRRHSPNLTGLESRSRSTTSTPITRPQTRRDARPKNGFASDTLKNGKSFRLVFTK